MTSSISRRKMALVRLGFSSCFLSVFGSSVTPSSGVKITATSHDRMSEIAMTTKSEKVYSPALLLFSPIGRKLATVTSVPVSIGNAVEV